MKPSLKRQQLVRPLWWAVFVGVGFFMRNMVSCPSPDGSTLPSLESLMQISNSPPANLRSKNEQAYDANYWAWQEGMNAFGAVFYGDVIRHILKGRPEVTNILEFGCSGGYILNGMPAKNRYGVEINPASRAHATKKFASTIKKVFVRTDDIPPSLQFDVIYTTQVLEHVDCPLCELRKLRSKLVKGGILIVGLKNDGADVAQDFSRHKGDGNHHIYTWNSLLLANLLDSAGFVPCNIIGQFDAWHAISVNTYNSDKLGYCREGLDVGRRGNVHNLWSVSVLDVEAEGQQCAELKGRVDQLMDCEYLKQHK